MGKSSVNMLYLRVLAATLAVGSIVQKRCPSVVIMLQEMSSVSPSIN